MPDGEQARTAATEFEYDVVILDLNLPKLDGVSVLRHLLSKKPSLPVLVLTQRTRVEDRVQCLDTRADDYPAKPFSFSELSARIRALVRRSHLPSESVLAAADLRLDRLQRLVERARRRVELTGKEFSLLEYLMLNAGRGVTRSMIIEHVWNLTFDTTTNVVDVYINYVETTSTLHIAFGEGIDYSVLYAIEQMMGCHTETCMAVPSFVRKNLQSISGHRGESEVVIDRVADAGEFSRIIHSYCVRLASPEIRLAGCGPSLWVRLLRSSRPPLDLLLRSSQADSVRAFPLPCCRASRCLHPRQAKRCKRKAAPRVFHRNNPVLCDEHPLLSFLESTHWPHAQRLCQTGVNRRSHEQLSACR